MSIIEKAFNVLVKWGESLRSYRQLHQAKDHEVNNSGESRNERAAVFWSSIKA